MWIEILADVVELFFAVELLPEIDWKKGFELFVVDASPNFAVFNLNILKRIFNFLHVVFKIDIGCSVCHYVS